MSGAVLKVGAGGDRQGIATDGGPRTAPLLQSGYGQAAPDRGRVGFSHVAPSSGRARVRPEQCRIAGGVPRRAPHRRPFVLTVPGGRRCLKGTTMTSILPSGVDRWRAKRNGKRRYVGQIIRFGSPKRMVIAEVYGNTLREMSRRKRAVWVALRDIEDDPPGRRNDL